MNWIRALVFSCLGLSALMLLVGGMLAWLALDLLIDLVEIVFHKGNALQEWLQHAPLTPDGWPDHPHEYPGEDYRPERENRSI